MRKSQDMLLIFCVIFFKWIKINLLYTYIIAYYEEVSVIILCKGQKIYM